MGLVNQKKKVERSEAVVNSCVALNSSGSGQGGTQAIDTTDRWLQRATALDTQWTTVPLSMRHLAMNYWGSSDRCQRGAQELLSFPFPFSFLLFPHFLSEKLKDQGNCIYRRCPSIGGSECKMRLLRFPLKLEQLTAASKQHPIILYFLYLDYPSTSMFFLFVFNCRSDWIKVNLVPIKLSFFWGKKGTWKLNFNIISRLCS